MLASGTAELPSAGVVGIDFGDFNSSQPMPRFTQAVDERERAPLLHCHRQLEDHAETGFRVTLAKVVRARIFQPPEVEGRTSTV